MPSLHLMVSYLRLCIFWNVLHMLNKLCHVFLLAKNVHEVKETMRKIRSVIGYFEKSTQATKKLLDFQRNSRIPEYRDQPHPKKLIPGRDHEVVVNIP